MPSIAQIPKGWSVGTKIAVGTGTLLAVAAAVYLLTGKRGERNRAKIRKLAGTVKREAMKGMKAITPEQVGRTVHAIEHHLHNAGRKTRKLRTA